MWFHCSNNNEPAFSKLFWEKLKNFNITSFGTVPAVYDYLKESNLKILFPPLH